MSLRGRKAPVGSEPSAASGRGSEVSEWPRSKFPASAARQRRNFGHRNRDIRIPRPPSHGKAVTGGFFFLHTGRARGPCPTKHCVIRPGGQGRPPLQTYIILPLQKLPQFPFHFSYFLTQFRFIHRKLRVFKAFYHHFIFDQHPPNHASGGFLCFCKPDVFLV